MKNSFFSMLLLALFSTLFFTTLHAQDSTRVKSQKHVQQFIDKNGDGYNDNAPDDDGDGIPNSLDPDWQKIIKGKGKGQKRRFVDLNGDGINDYNEKLYPGRGEHKGTKQTMLSKEKGTSMDQNMQKQGQQKRKGKH